MPVNVCLATRRTTARLVIRHDPTAAKSGHLYWPLLVVGLCPFDMAHGHLHTMLAPLPAIKHAPCNRQPYAITGAVA